MPAYVLVTHGRNPGSQAPRKYGAAARQIRALKQVSVKQFGKEPRQWVCDYRRTITDLTELPVLMKLLSTADRQGVPVLMDDVRRIFGICPLSQRPELLKQLMDTPGANQLIGFRQGGHFIKSVEQNPKRFIIWDGSVGFPSKLLEDDRPDFLKRAQTRKGTDVSAKRRGIAAARNDRTLSDLKTQLEQEGKKVTHKALA